METWIPLKDPREKGSERNAGNWVLSWCRGRVSEDRKACEETLEGEPLTNSDEK